MARARRPARALGRVAVVLACACARARGSAATTAAEERSFFIDTHVTRDGARCEIGPYGWFCVPSTIQYSYTVHDPNTVYEGDDVTDAVDACEACETCARCAATNLTCARAESAGCFGTCGSEETNDVLTKCGTAAEVCKNVQFDVVRADLREEISYAYEFFVNELNGSDAWQGTREMPWKTLARAERRVRFLRAVTEASGLGRALVRPVQVWIRDAYASPGADPLDNVSNGRYSGVTYSE